MSETIYLYIKTHNKTGLKYLGKTKQDPFEYKGSGVYWVNHIKVHGNDVTTEVLASCSTPEEIKELGLYYSKLFNIVESSDWANLMEENGVGGANKTSFKKGLIPANKGKKSPEISKAKFDYWKKWKEENLEYKAKWKINNYEKKGYAKVSELGKKQTAINNTTMIVCPHCDKQSNVGNAKRWHFDNCRFKD